VAGRWRGTRGRLRSEAVPQLAWSLSAGFPPPPFPVPSAASIPVPARSTCSGSTMLRTQTRPPRASCSIATTRHSKEGVWKAPILSYFTDYVSPFQLPNMSIRKLFASDRWLFANGGKSIMGVWVANGRETGVSQSDMASGARMFFGYDMGRWQ